MPEMIFTVRWPDGRTDDCYSPSLVVHDHLRVGGRYPVAEFDARAAAALSLASDRVEARYGVPCGRARSSAARITAIAAGYPPDAAVEVLAMEPPMPLAEPVPSPGPSGS